MKKKIGIGIVSFLLICGIVAAIWGGGALNIALFAFAWIIAFAIFDYLIYIIARWAHRKSKGLRIFGYIVAGYLSIGVLISAFMTSSVSPDFPLVASIMLAILELVALGFIIYKVRSFGIYEEYGDREIEEKYAPSAPVSIANMDGHTFEHFCADLLRANGYTNVSVTAASGDQGVDILAEQGGLKFAIQCKKWSYPIGNTAVQEVSAGKAFYKCDVAVVLTNSAFTKGAIELAEATGVLLWDGVKLQELMENAAAPDEERQARSASVFGKSEYEFTCQRCGHTWYMTGGEIRSANAAKRNVNYMKTKRFWTLNMRKANNLSAQIAITEPSASYDKCPACGSHNITRSRA